jgi:cytochrome c551/c552
MTISPLKMLPLACLLWLSSFLIAAPAATGTAGQAEHRANPHRDLSLFSHSENCVACHNNLSSASGEDVSIGSMWRATMMANSARDPYWQASVRRETIDHQTRAADIQDECASCHMPMTQRISRASGGKGEVFAHLPIDARSDSDWERLAADSVSCTVCHQIAAETLGTRESFNANFVMKPTPPDGARPIYGPYQIDAGRRTIMHSVSGFAQEEAPHMKQSELCASCHTLITDALGPNGEVIGSLPEQMNYLEWKHSEFSQSGKSCQSCHMPSAPGPIRIASVLGDQRDSLARHVFVGGNVHMLGILNRYRAALGVTALSSELERTAQATIRQLQQDTATLTVTAPRREGGTVAFEVTVDNLSGHKFPTGYPSRRAWLHVTIRDERDSIVFESGAVDDAGRIRGNASDSDSGSSASSVETQFEPHYAVVTAADQVQIYEAILGDRNGGPTTGLLSAVRYLKDNRLLPRGFDKETADAEIGVYGEARQDGSFMGGRDTTSYRVPVTGAGPFAVDVELRYQPIAYRWAHNLDRYDAPEPKRFVSYYDATSSASSVVVARATARASEAAPQRREQKP